MSTTSKYSDVIQKALSTGTTNPAVTILNLRNMPEADTPTPDEMEYGQVAINFNPGNERLFIKNRNDEIVSFGSTESLNNKISEIQKELQDQIDVITADKSVEGSFAYADKIISETLREEFLKEIEKITGIETSSVIVTVDLTSKEISANVKISEDPTNDLKITSTGLYSHTSEINGGSF